MYPRWQPNGRAHDPSARRGTLGPVGVALALLALPVWLGGSLAFGLPMRRWLDVFLDGIVVGTILVVLAERTGVPERLCGFGG